jgi:hypothetical protein
MIIILYSDQTTPHDNRHNESAQYERKEPSHRTGNCPKDANHKARDGSGPLLVARLESLGGMVGDNG